jgi:peptide/nickel transport system ATP-binding protein
MQMIFQDPISSLNPLRKVNALVREPLNIWGIGSRAERAARVQQVLDDVGMDGAVAGERRSREFSGGQCQRLSIARALVLDPSFIICDEPVSSLDVSIQAQVINLLEELKGQYGLTLLFIAHDLAVVKNISDRIAVMYLGKLCEVAPPDALFAQPAHPYTIGLLRSIPVPDPDVKVDPSTRIVGEVPSPINPPSGCRMRYRCPYAQERCAAEEPRIRDVGGGHFVACHFPVGFPEAPALEPATDAP